MKASIYMTAVLLGSLTLLVAQASACELNLSKTKAKGKTYYTVKGDSLSSKNVAKLARVCGIHVKIMTPNEVIFHKIKRLKNKIAR